MAAHPAPIDHTGHEPSPRWPAIVALLVIGGLYMLMSDRVSLGPPWLTLTVIVALLIPLNVAHQRGAPVWARRFAIMVTGAVTVAVGASALLIAYDAVLGRGVPGVQLLFSGILVWSANVLVFAIWYWEIDSGGPSRRHRDCYFSHDFVFPQMAVPHIAPPKWAPAFTDYLFLAFNTSTAFSPTDTMVLSRPAKVLMMLQSSLSLLVVAVLVARAVNTIGSQPPDAVRSNAGILLPVRVPRGRSPTAGPPRAAGQMGSLKQEEAA